MNRNPISDETATFRLRLQMHSVKSIKMEAMSTATTDVISVVNQITSRLMTLPVNDLYEVARFIEALETSSAGSVSEAMACALASEATLAKYWDTPEEDAAWADLSGAML